MKANIKFGLAGLLGVAVVVLPSQAAESVLWRADFTDKATWLAPREYSGTIKYSIKPDMISVGGTATNMIDTAWQIETKNVPIAYEGKYALVFTFTSRGITKHYVKGSPGWDSALCWYDANGNLLERQALNFALADMPPFEYRLVQVVPPGACSFRVKLGWDSPNLLAKQGARVQNLRLEAAGGDAALGLTQPDIAGPRIKIVSATPTKDAAAPVVLTILSEQGVSADSITITANGVARTDFTRKTVSGGFEITLPPGESPWSEGLNWLAVKAEDARGVPTEAKKCFLIGEVPKTPAVTLRDDGMTLIGGEPFFPIGIYAVCKRDFNAYDWDRAVSDLKAAGFNLLHSYNAPRDRAFHAAVQKYGMKMWMCAYQPDDEVVRTFRHMPWVIAWYLGDDTSMNTTIHELWDRDDNIRAVDPTRLTTQADVLAPNFHFYAPQTDNFLPEIYPVGGSDQPHDRKCVAEVNRTMRACIAAQAKDPHGRRHSNWPIIQQFKGWGWKRFPTPEEFYGMNFAALVQGAQGITWYTYGGFVNEGKKTFNYGVTSSEQVWTTTTNCTRRIASLVPVLVERTGAQPPKPTIVAGPAKDGYDGDSVTALLKTHQGGHYLLTVNSADAPVKARFAPNARGHVEVLWENRTLTPDAQGGFEDAFAPLAVHVYRW